MNSIVRLVLRSCSRRWIQKETSLLDGRKESQNFQPIRYYKDFGHARQTEPLATILFLGLGAFVFFISGLRYIHDLSDIYEEGEDRGKPENERLYRLD